MKAPIFVVGCPRSGTTLVQRILDQHPGISCGPESFILDSLHNMERQRWADLANLGITQAQWRSHIRELFSWVHEQRALAKNKDRWADKTPMYALILEFIDDLYPDCQVIHVIRDPLDVIDSWRRRVGNLQARQAVHAWPEHVRAAKAFGETRSGDRYTEIRYEDLVAQPEKVMRPTIEWLGEPWDNGILHLPPRKRTQPLESSERTRRRRARWLGNPIADESPGTGQADSGGVPIESSKDPAIQDAPDPKDEWPILKAAPNEIVSSSVGVGSRGRNLLVNAPYLIQLERVAGPLVRELGYARPLSTYWEAIRSARSR